MLGKCVNYLRVVSWWRVDSLVAISFVAKWSGGEVTGFRFSQLHYLRYWICGQAGLMHLYMINTLNLHIILERFN